MRRSAPLLLLGIAGVAAVALRGPATRGAPSPKVPPAPAAMETSPESSRLLEPSERTSSPSGAWRGDQPILSRREASIRIQEALAAAGWPYPHAEFIEPRLSLELDIHRAPRIWCYLPEGEAHVQIDADSGALLYLSPRGIFDRSEWESLPKTKSAYPDYLLPPAPPVPLEQARRIAVAMIATQFTAYTGRQFPVTKRERAVKALPVWDLEFREPESQTRFVNAAGLLVEWATGRVFEFHATARDAECEARIDESAAILIAGARWNGKPTAGIRTRLRVELDEHGLPFPLWWVRFQALDGEQLQVTLHGVSGALISSGGSMDD